MASNNSAANYLSASEAYGNFEGAKPFPGTEKLSKEVGQINSLGGSTGFTATTDLQKKQAESTDGGCGTSFTTATDPKNISVKHEISGNFIEVATVNDQGDPQKKWIASNGTSMTFAEDGSVIYTTSKREGDPNSGRFDVCSHGSTRFKIGEALLIVVDNKNKVVAAKDGGKEGPAMSITVYGNIDVSSVSGDINVKGKNINLNAENELKLNAGSKISLLSGKGKGQNESKETTKGKEEAKSEYGGVVEVKAGDFTVGALTTRKSSSMDYKIIEAEGAVLSTNQLANYGIQSPGSFTLDVGGDFHEKIGGLKRTDISATANPATTIFPGQLDGWITNIGEVTGNAFFLDAAGGGINMYTRSGDVILQTESGGFIVDSKTAGGVAGVDIDKKGADGKPLGLTPGVYLRGYKKSVYIGTDSGSDISIALGAATAVKTVTNGIKISTAKLEIKNTTGIYLN